MDPEVMRLPAVTMPDNLTPQGQLIMTTLAVRAALGTSLKLAVHVLMHPASALGAEGCCVVAVGSCSVAGTAICYFHLGWSSNWPTHCTELHPALAACCRAWYSNAPSGTLQSVPLSRRYWVCCVASPPRIGPSRGVSHLHPPLQPRFERRLMLLYHAIVYKPQWAVGLATGPSWLAACCCLLIARSQMSVPEPTPHMILLFFGLKTHAHKFSPCLSSFSSLAL